MEQIRAPKTHATQWSVLVDFLMEHPELVTKSFVGLGSRQNYKRMWDQIAAHLNSMGLGSKSTAKWIDASTKWKSKIKIKAQSIRLGMNRTGGGGPLPPLTPIEETLMGIIGWKVVDGDGSMELGLENKENCLLSLTNNTNEIPLTDGTFDQLVQLQLVAILTGSKSLLKTDTTTIETPTTSTNPQLSKKRKMSSEPIKKRARFQRKGDSITLQRVHEETIDVLKQINKNLSRLGNIQRPY